MFTVSHISPCRGEYVHVYNNILYVCCSTHVPSTHVVNNVCTFIQKSFKYLLFGIYPHVGLMHFYFPIFLDDYNLVEISTLGLVVYVHSSGNNFEMSISRRAA